MYRPRDASYANRNIPPDPSTTREPDGTWREKPVSHRCGTAGPGHTGRGQGGSDHDDRSVPARLHDVGRRHRPVPGGTRLVARRNQASDNEEETHR